MLRLAGPSGHRTGCRSSGNPPRVRERFVEEPPAGSPAFYWTHVDHLDTALAITDTPASGNARVVWTASYEPYGLATPDEDPDGDSVFVSYQPRFPGQWFDGESGDHYNHRRSYDPAVAAYISGDPVGQRGGLNIYRYALSSPTNYYDPTGNAPKGERRRTGSGDRRANPGKKKPQWKNVKGKKGWYVPGAEKGSWKPVPPSRPAEPTPDNPNRNPEPIPPPSDHNPRPWEGYEPWASPGEPGEPHQFAPLPPPPPWYQPLLWYHQCIAPRYPGWWDPTGAKSRR